jgi:hypothetical protein
MEHSSCRKWTGMEPFIEVKLAADPNSDKRF